tara:strand:- start:334 stop:441 length:108 start_codon:yes stop_codon:yes gene_type:complete
LFLEINQEKDQADIQNLQIKNQQKKDIENKEDEIS